MLKPFHASQRLLLGIILLAAGINAIAQNTSSHCTNDQALGGTFNTGYGTNALLNVGAASIHNTAVGFAAAKGLVGATGNTAAGANAYGAATSGTNNTGIGVETLLSATTISNNTAVGYKCLNKSAAENNTGVGYNCLAFTTTGANNVGFGAYALYKNTTGTRNTSAGSYSLYNNTTASYNVAIGGNSLLNNNGTTGADGTYNTAFGYNALYYNTTGYCNTAFGSHAVYKNATGLYNTGVGQAALYNNTANYITAAGYNALYSNTSGTFNTALGSQALYGNTTGTNNTAAGYQALYTNTTASYNTAVGVQALSLATGTNNTGFGQLALRNATGSYNTAVGAYALAADQTGTYNTAFGQYALRNLNGSSFNVAAGYLAGTAKVTYTGCTFLGANTDAIPNGLNNSTAIGWGATITQWDEMVLGGFYGQYADYIVGGGTIGYSPLSDGRFKYNVTEDVKGLEFIKRLKPVVYNMDFKRLAEFHTKHLPEEARQKRMAQTNFEASTAVRQTGFIAQQVDSAATMAGYDFDGVHKPRNENDTYGLAYSQFVVPLVKGMQEQQKVIETRLRTAAEMRQQIYELGAQLHTLKESYSHQGQ